MDEGIFNYMAANSITERLMSPPMQSSVSMLSILHCGIAVSQPKNPHHEPPKRVAVAAPTEAPITSKVKSPLPTPRNHRLSQQRYK